MGKNGYQMGIKSGSKGFIYMGKIHYIPWNFLKLKIHPQFEIRLDIMKKGREGWENEGDF